MLALRSIARRVLQLTAEERELAREIETLTRKLAPQLLDQPGVGPHAAAQLVLSWSHHGRISSEAAFARLAGAAPIPASSGQTIRYRLDRSGDRKLNRALHMILVTRKRSHPATIAYIERRTPRRQDTTRSKPLPQALPRPQPLPPPRTRTATGDLTNIEASLAQPGVCCLQRRDLRLDRGAVDVRTLPDQPPLATKPCGHEDTGAELALVENLNATRPKGVEAVRI